MGEVIDLNAEREKRKNAWLRNLGLALVGIASYATGVIGW